MSFAHNRCILRRSAILGTLASLLLRRQRLFGRNAPVRMKVLFSLRLLLNRAVCLRLMSFFADRSHVGEQY